MRAQGELTLTLTETGLVVGTLAYMSPEQLRGDPVDERADVFSFGMMALEALTETLPKRNPDGTLVPSALPKLLEAVMACLANNPDGRCASLADIRENLVSALQTYGAGPSAASA